MVEVRNFSFDDPVENLPRMAHFAAEFSKDIPGINMPKVRAMIERYGPLSQETSQALFEFIQSKYLLEEEEQFLRPLYFSMIGGDCDDQAIFVAAFYLHYGWPPGKIFFIESAERENYFEHIFTAVRGIAAFDALPGMKMGELSGRFHESYNLADLLTLT